MKKMNLIFVPYFIAIFLLLVTNAEAAMINASSCSETHVKEAINKTSSGDTVVVPAGKCTWSSGVTIPNGVTLRGAGIGSTVISSSSFITTNLGNSSRITGFEFTNGFAKGYCTQNWVADYCKFTAVAYDSNGQYIGSSSCSDHPAGVYHKCTLEHMRFIIEGTSIPSKDWYTNYPPLGGTDHVIYFEGCTFNSYGDYNNGVDSTRGGARVVRFSTINDCPMGSHGASASAARGTVRHSMYRNTWNHSSISTSSYAWWFRGGSGMIFDNTCKGEAAYCDASIDFERAYRPELTICNSSTGYETVPHPEGGLPNYMCRDGVGTGKDLGPNPQPPTYTYGQESSPLYIWNQTNINFGTSNGAEAWVIENRDYYRDKGLGGVTTGLYANRPTCNASKKNHGYWATDMGGNWNATDEWGGADGALYVCDGVSTWNLHYTPAPYPHPLLQAVTGEVIPKPPVGFGIN